MAVHKLRVHHVATWFHELYTPKEAELSMICDDVEEYEEFCLNTAPEVYRSFSLEDKIKIVQYMDSVCKKCPKPQSKWCYRFEGYDIFTKNLGLKIGKEYKVKDVLKKFEDRKAELDAMLP